MTNKCLYYRKLFAMNLIKFIESFPDEASCRIKFKEFRDSQGVICRKCGNRDHYWLKTVEEYQCSTKKTFSALELQRQIGHKYYEPIWYMLQKLRKTMGSRDSKYKLDKIVELDEGFFESVDKEKDDDEKSAPRKRGRGSQKQTTVMVMALSLIHISEP